MNPYYNYLYVDSGLYAAQIERYLQNISKRATSRHIIWSSKTNPVATTQRVYDFLGVDSSFIPQNQGTQQPKFLWLSTLLQRLLRYLYKIRIPACSGFIELHATNLFLGGSTPVLLRNVTCTNTTKTISRKTSLINRDLTAWLTGSWVDELS